MTFDKHKYDNLLTQLAKLRENSLREIKIKEQEIINLKETIENNRDAVDALPVGVVVFDKEGYAHLYNKFFTKLFGYTHKDVPNVQVWFQKAYPNIQYREQVSQRWQLAIEDYHKTGHFNPIEARVKCKDGSYKEIEFGFEAIGETYLTTFVDVSERNTAQRAHLQAVEFNEDLINSLPAIFFMYGIDKNDARLVKWNRNHEVKLGYPHEELYGKSIYSFFKREYIRDIRNTIEKLKKYEELDIETQILHANGKLIPYHFKAKTFIEEGHKFFYGIGIDISEQKEAEKALKNSEEKYRSLYENANDAIFILDDDTVIDCNEQTLKMFDCKKDEIIGKTPYDFSPLYQPDGMLSKEKVDKILQDGLYEKQTTFDWMHCTSKGKMFYAEVGLNRVDMEGKEYSQAIVRNINEKKLAQIELEKYKNQLENLVKDRTSELQSSNEELKSTNDELNKVNQKINHQKEQLSKTLNQLKDTQSQLVQSEKMASLGILTAGVSHEINNPLNYIQAGIYSLENLIKNNSLLPEYETFTTVLGYMQEGVDRVSKIVKSLNSFSKIGGSKKSKFKIHKVINNCISMLENEANNKCSIEKYYFDNKFKIFADEAKMHHVFMNIIVNAIDAIDKNGTIKIKTNLTGNGNLIQIIVEDNGEGISKENLKKIYDPFFTTKDPGKGTGLGLSTVFRIIKEHKGTIRYESEINQGTKVLITLPIN